MFKRIVWISLVAISLQAANEPPQQPATQGITFLDYYHGNPAKGVESHKDYVLKGIQSRSLSLGGISGVQLIDLEGLADVPGIEGITCLKLSTNLLTTIPMDLIKLVNLQELYLAWNKLAEFPTVICELKNLHVLDLHFNQLIDIPECVGDLTQLTSLFLGENRLTQLPASIGNLVGLHLLYLNDNELTQLPESIAQLTHLNSLVLSDNMLISLPDLRALTHLQSLDVADNPLPLTSNEIRMALPSLTALSWKMPELEQVQQDLFAAIMEGGVSKARAAFGALKRGAKWYGNDVAKIVDAYGNNLLHAAIQRASEHLNQVTKQMNSLEKHFAEQTSLVKNLDLSEKEKKEQLRSLKDQEAKSAQKLIDQTNEINDRYMKIFAILLDCSLECVDAMLNATNKEGQTVIMALLGKLGADHPIFKTIQKVLIEEGEEVETKAKKAHEAEEKKIKEEQSKAHRIAFEHERKQRQQEEKESKQAALKLHEEEAAVYKKNILNSLFELRGVADKNKLTQLSKQVQQVVTWVSDQPYTSVVLGIAIDMLKNVNRDAKIKYHGSQTTVNNLLEPIIAKMNRDSKAMGG